MTKVLKKEKFGQQSLKELIHTDVLLVFCKTLNEMQSVCQTCYNMKTETIQYITQKHLELENHIFVEIKVKVNM